MEQIKRETQTKKGGKYITTGTDTDAGRVYEDLARRLISKKLCGCTWIRSITRKYYYTYAEIIVTYDNGTRDIFTINEH